MDSRIDFGEDWLFPGFSIDLFGNFRNHHRESFDSRFFIFERFGIDNFYFQIRKI